MSRLFAWVAVALLVFAPVVVEAQFFSENFDSYAAGSSIIGQGGWEGWDGASTPGYVSNSQAYSSPNSLLVDGTCDVVHQFGGITTGTWWIRVRVYIPSSQTGNTYFIVLNTYAHGGPYNWSSQLRFSATDGVVESVGGTDNPSGATAALVTNQWTEAWIEVDLDANTQNIYYQGVQFDSIPWNVSGANAIATFDLFSDGASESYMDNVWLDSSFPVELTTFTVE